MQDEDNITGEETTVDTTRPEVRARLLEYCWELVDQGIVKAKRDKTGEYQFYLPTKNLLFKDKLVRMIENRLTGKAVRELLS
jgi:hypothetical protein